MLSLPTSKTFTTLHKFTTWSAFIAYFVNGLLGVAFPTILNFAMFNMKLSGRENDYVRIICAQLVVIGFLYVVTARSRPKADGNGAILGTVPERLFFVSAVLIWLYQQSLIPILFATAFAGLDSTLAVVTFIIWFRGTPGASPMKGLREIADMILPVLKPMQKWSSKCTQIVGYFQIVVSLTFMFEPEIARDALCLDTFGRFSKGLIALFFMSNVVISWLHILGGGDGNESSPIAAVFYRLVWNVPLVAIMYFFGRIEEGFAVAMGTSDLIGAFIILIPLCFESLSSKTKN